MLKLVIDIKMELTLFLVAWFGSVSVCLAVCPPPANVPVSLSVQIEMIAPLLLRPKSLPSSS